MSGTVNNSELIIVACYYVVIKQPLPHSTALTDLSSWNDLLRRRTEVLLFLGRALDAFSFSTRRWAQSAPPGGGKGPNGSPHSTPICGSSSSSGSNCDVPAPTSTKISHYREHRPSFSSTGTVCLWTTEFHTELYVILTPPLPHICGERRFPASFTVSFHLFPPTYTWVISHTFTPAHSTLIYMFRLYLSIFRNS